MSAGAVAPTAGVGTSASRTLLMTDLVDSTQLSEALGDAAMAPLWRAHDAASRALIAQWHGREVARSDGFLVLFESPGDAAGFALAYHRALQALQTPLKARVGLHVGPVSIHANSEIDRLRGAPDVERSSCSRSATTTVRSSRLPIPQSRTG
jgi:class 3 adenylate cyclase